MFNQQEYYNELNELLKKGEPVWQAIVTNADGSTPARTGMHLAVPLSGSPIGNLGGGNMEHQVIDMIRKEQVRSVKLYEFVLDSEGKPIEAAPNTEIKPTSMICGGRVDVMIEPLFYPHQLYIIGGGHCGKALSNIAALIGFQVTVVDNRKEQLLPELFHPSCKLIYNDFKDITQAVSFNEGSYIVIMTHGHIHDRHVLETCLRKPSRYLGMIGSKKKVEQTFNKLKENGYTSEELENVCAPIGLPIKSQTPYEVAVSIAAQLIQIRNS